MNDTTDPVDNLSALFNHLDSFFPIIKTPDLLPSELFPSQSLESFSLQSLQQAISPPLQFVFQNVNKSNISMHTLLNSYLPWSSNTPSILSANPCLTADIVMVLEPWWGWIGIDTKMNQDKIGTINNHKWTLILPTILDPYPDVIAYIRNSRKDVHFSPRLDLCDSPSVIVRATLRLDHSRRRLFTMSH